MKRKHLIIVVSLAIILIVIFVLIDMAKFADGVQKDTMKRNEYLKKNGTRLDSMGNVKYEDFKIIEDSLQEKNK